MRLIPEYVRREQLTRLLAADGYTFVGWDGPYKGSRSRAKFKCVKHGDCTSTVNNILTNGARCWDCGHESTINQCRTSAVEAEQTIREKAMSVGHAFLGWVDGEYTSLKGKCELRCKIHGIWITTVESFMLSPNGCPGCKAVAFGDRRRIPEQDRYAQITSVCLKTGVTFKGWKTAYTGGSSRMIVECSKHGEWNPTVGTFVDQGQGCPGCARTGFDSTKRGYVYALLSECRKHLKVGISNKPNQRVVQLRRSTPFSFSKIAHITFQNGAEAFEFEQLVHKNFESSGLSGFPGSTEWVKYSPDVITWFELSNGVVDATHVE